MISLQQRTSAVSLSLPYFGFLGITSQIEPVNRLSGAEKEYCKARGNRSVIVFGGGMEEIYFR